MKAPWHSPGLKGPCSSSPGRHRDLYQDSRRISRTFKAASLQELLAFEMRVSAGEMGRQRSYIPLIETVLREVSEPLEMPLLE